MPHNVALLGAGNGAKHLDTYLHLSDSFQVRYICDLDQDRAVALAAKADNCQIIADLKQALADPNIDIVDICLPPSLHVSTALAAFKAGKHVVCEKPLANSVVEAERLLATADTHPDLLLVAIYQHRYAAAFARLNALHEADLLGQPQVATLETHWNRGHDYYTNNWRGTRANAPSGAMLSHALHAHDLVTRYFGDVRTVSALFATRSNNIENQDCAALTMHTVSSALITSSVTLGAATDTTRLRFVFEHLTATGDTFAYTPSLGAWQFIARNPTSRHK